MPEQFLVGSDLDRTLIYSKNSLWLEGEDKDAPAMVVSEVYDAAPLSYMTRAAEALLLEISQLTTFTPVTTRTQAQYERIQLPVRVAKYAVTSNGGVILKDGLRDHAWHNHITDEVAQKCQPLPVIEAYLSQHEFSPWILRVRQAEDLFVYAIVDRESIPAGFITELEAVCAAAGWSLSLQGRKLYCVPLPVNKAAALAEVAKRTESDTIIAAGDSLLDQQMLELADIAFRPLHGELHDAGFTAPHLRLTSSRGILAGQEILRGILDIIRPAGH